MLPAKPLLERVIRNFSGIIPLMSGTQRAWKERSLQVHHLQ